MLDDPPPHLLDLGPVRLAPPRHRRGGRGGDFLHERVTVDVLERALQHQGASVGDHAVDVRSLGARENEFPDIGIGHGVGRAQSLQVEHDHVAAAAWLQPPGGGGCSDDSRAAVPGEAEHVGCAQSRVLVLAPHALQHVGDAQLREHVVVVRQPHVVEPEGDAHARRHQLPEGSDTGRQAQVRGAVVHDRRTGGSEQVDVGVAQPHAVRERAPVAEYAGGGESLELSPIGEAIAPRALQPALEGVQMNARAELRRRRPDRLDERVARPLRRHDRELDAQPRIAGELASELPDRGEVGLGGHARAGEAARPVAQAREAASR